MKWSFKSKDVDPVLQRLADSINQKNGSNLVNPEDSVYYAKEVTFYSDFKLFTFVDLSFTPYYQVRLLDNGFQTIVLDGTIKPFLEAANQSPLVLTKQNVFEYANVVLSNIEKEEGCSHLVESIDDIEFSSEPTPEQFVKLETSIKAATVSKDNGSFRISASLVYGDSVFDTTIQVTQDGVVEIVYLEKLLDSMPIKEMILE